MVSGLPEAAESMPVSELTRASAQTYAFLALPYAQLFSGSGDAPEGADPRTGVDSAAKFDRDYLDVQSGSVQIIESETSAQRHGSRTHYGLNHIMTHECVVRGSRVASGLRETT